MTYEQAVHWAVEGRRVWEPSMNVRWCVRAQGDSLYQESTTGATLPYVPTEQQRTSKKWRIM